ncbi:DUF4347 domain-containing protein, partial [Aphanizomenon flos-aquae]
MINNIPNTLVFLDSNVADYQSLIQQAKPGTEVIIIDAQKDGIEQITQALAQREGITSVQIISHGGEGEIQLGTTLLNSATLQKYSQQLQEWRKALTAEADILLLGCNVAAGEIGKDFIAKLSEITGADVAASDDVTGNAKLGGNWDLEIQTGTIESSLAISDATLDAYDHVLAIKDWYQGNIGEGLLGAYFDNNSLDKSKVAKVNRIDPTINYDWQREKADSQLTQTDFSVEWTGKIISSYTPGLYEFYITSDDGARLYIQKNGVWELVIDQWGQINRDVVGSIFLEAETTYSLKLQLRDTGGNATMQLSWKKPDSGTLKEIIPSRNFIPDTDTTDNISVRVPTVSIVGTPASENSKEAKFTIKTDTLTEYTDGRKGVTVYYQIDGGQEQKILVDSYSKDLSINIDDTSYNPGRTITVHITRGSYLRGTSSAIIDVTDNEPNFTITRIADATEGGANPQFQLVNNNNVRTNRDITFYYQIDLNTASNPKAILQDFTTIYLSRSVVFPSGASSQIFTLPIINDDKLYEGQIERFRIIPISSSEYTATNDNQDYSLSDNEPLISLQSYSSVPQEGAAFNGSQDGLFLVDFSVATPQQFFLELGLETSSKSATPGAFVATTKGADYKIY